MAKQGRKKGATSQVIRPETYQHPEADSPLRPEVGTQAQFRKKKPPTTYCYDSSLSPALDWDGQNPAREQGEALIREILEADSLEQAKTAAAKLRALSKPFLNWAGKAERLSFDVPTLPLFIHERLSTKAIVETLQGHRKDQGVGQLSLFNLFADPQHSITDQVLRAYEYRDQWVNRLILGDSLVVMNSLLRYEGLGGQVQMIYMDPPYGIKFGSNFQPFVRKRDVKHNDDEGFTREPEMVKAYRDTWELGLHSYLTYLRDRLLLARELLHPSGSIFVQISDENLHHVREVMDEVFGGENFVSVVTFAKTSGYGDTSRLASVSDYLLWYVKEIENLKFNQLYLSKQFGSELAAEYKYVELPDKVKRPLAREELENQTLIPQGSRFFRPSALTSQGATETGNFDYTFEGEPFRIGNNQHWKTTKEGLDRLVAAGRVMKRLKSLSYVRYLDDFPVVPIVNTWDDTRWGFDASEKAYVVQTNVKVIERCLLMTTDPGDLVLDPTCVRKGTRVLTPLNPPVNGGTSSVPGNEGTYSLPVDGEGWGGVIEGTHSRSVNGGTLSVRGSEGTYSLPVDGEGWGGVIGIPIESIQPGDFVFCHDGKPHRVLRTICKPYRGRMVGIQHRQSSQTLWITEDHRILCQKRTRSYGATRSWQHIPKSHFQRARELRKEMTSAEQKLWSALRGKQLKTKFRKQHPIGSYIADFYSWEAGLVIEVDGDSHFTPEGQEYDRERDAYLASLGLTVLRFTNLEITSQIEGVLEKIVETIQQVQESDDHSFQWRRADSLQVGDVIYFGLTQHPVEIIHLFYELTEEEVYDLEVEEAHSFITEVCTVHNCGSGTTAYVAEQWSRRWITIDTSRVPLALARQRLLTATFPWYELKDPQRGPAGGFVYKRKQNSKGEEIGGIVPHVTLKSIANNEPPAEEVLVDRPEEDKKIVRVSGPFVVEATIPTPADWEGDGQEDSGQAESYGSFVERMLEVLRRSPVLQIGGGKTVTLKHIRPPAKTLSLSAEAVAVPFVPVVHGTPPQPSPSTGREPYIPPLTGGLQESKEKGIRRNKGEPYVPPLTGGLQGGSHEEKPVAFVFGPENGAVSEKLVFEAAREAHAKSYTHLYVIGFAIQPNAQQLVETCEATVGIPATYVQATPDLMMGDLLKNMRSSQIFSVCGLPEVQVTRSGTGQCQVELLGLDVFDPVTMEVEHRRGDDVPAWFLDTDYNGLCFHVCQAFFPRTGAWENLKKALKVTHEESVWDHLAGTMSAPFEAGEHGQIAVKVIDDRGNELVVIKSLKEAKK
jgi:very-short-patch-repair endonuclease/DNA modification methylase